MFSQCFSVVFFFMTLNGVLSESTVIEHISEDGPLLERIARLEVKMELVEKEIDVVKDVLADNVAEIKNVLEPLNEVIGKMSEDFDTLRGNSWNKTDGGTRDVQQVAFTAYNPAEKSLTPGRTVVFKSVLLNEGNGYNPSTGEFTATADGLYLFSVHVCNAGAKDVAYGIVHEGIYIAYSVQYQPAGESCSSTNALRMIRVGQKRVRTSFEHILKDGPLLERVAQLEVKMEFVEKENDVVKDVIADNVAEIKTVLEPLNEIMGKEFRNSRDGGTRDTPRVAFTAYNPAERSLTGKTVVFKSALLNEGNGYNPSTGESTAPNRRTLSVLCSRVQRRWKRCSLRYSARRNIYCFNFLDRAAVLQTFYE